MAGGSDGCRAREFRPQADLAATYAQLRLLCSDRAIKDFGSQIEGHGRIMDRIDSLCFAAPLFFHVVRYSYA